MAKGRKTGGRVRGTPNKATADVASLIDGLVGDGAVECFKQLATIALEPHSNVKARLSANRTLIEYRHGRPPEFVRVTGGDGGPVQIHHHFSA